MTVQICTRSLSLAVDTDQGLNPFRLSAPSTEWTIAHADYHYGFGRPQRVHTTTTPAKDGSTTTVFTGTVSNGIEVSHCFTSHAEEGWIDEWIELTNIGESSVTFDEACNGRGRGEGPALRAGFTLNGPTSAGPGQDALLTWLPVPFLRSTETGEKRSYTPAEVAEQPGGRCASEGWVLTHDDESLLVIKYNADALEHSVLSTHTDPDGRASVVFGGAGVFQGDPESAAQLVPGETLRLGTTRYLYISGGWKDAFYAFRSFMDSRGHRFSPGYDPPVHWNVIYDIPQWWHPPDNEACRAQHYSRAQLIEEAKKAREIGCEALYLDPGWDTHFGSTIWDAERLGPAKDFVREMKAGYGLSVSLHTPLANWNIDKSYPKTAWLRDEAGGSVKLSTWEGFDHGLCSAAPGWWETKRDRMLTLAAEGVRFLMFDGTNYTPCHDSTHGHSVPLTREEHIRGYAQLAREVRQQYPDVRIEMHDQVYGPVEQRYVPMYYTQGQDTFETIWGFEYMWYSMQDLLSGKALALYYYNLAYNIPLYLHVNLKSDNHHCLMFWWYASTCRHLGFGGRDVVASTTDLPEIGVGAGYTPDPVRWEAHCAAMKQYCRLKAFFSRGEFFGIDESTHVHALPYKAAAVVCCFNLTEQHVSRTVDFCPSDFGLPPAAHLQVVGADDWRENEGGLAFAIDLPARGVCMIEVLSKASEVVDRDE